MIILQSIRRPAPNSELLPSLGPILTALLPPMEAEGAAIIDYKDGGLVILSEVGAGSSIFLDAIGLIVTGLQAPCHAVSVEGHPIILGPWQTPAERQVVIAFWRALGAEAYDASDHKLIVMAAAIFGVVAVDALRPKDPAWRRNIDDLTGLPRARKLVEDLPRHFARLDRDELPGTLIIANIDGFNKIAGKYGTGVGDEMLRQTAKMFQALTRPTDVVARVGGEEFAIWLDGADQFVAAERAERLKAEAPLLAAAIHKPEVDVSFSVGIATRQPRSMETINSLMRRADYAMHEARKAGPGNWRVSQEKAT